MIITAMLYFTHVEKENKEKKEQEKIGQDKTKVKEIYALDYSVFKEKKLQLIA